MTRTLCAARAAAGLLLLGFLTVAPAHATGPCSRTYIDGNGVTKTALTGCNGTSDTTGVTLFDVNGNPVSPALAANQPGFGTAGSPNANVSSVQGVVGGTAMPISATSLPLPTNAATAANQAAPGTAGSPSSQVVSVQGVASGTVLPISGTVATSMASPVVTTVTPTITVATYAARKSLGGLLTFASALPTQKGAIEDVTMLVANGDTPVVTGTLYLFDTAPSGSTTCTDNTNVTIATADAGKIIAVLSIATTADASGATVPASGSSQGASSNTGRKLINASSSTIWGCFVINTATAFAASSDALFRLKTISY